MRTQVIIRWRELPLNRVMCWEFPPFSCFIMDCRRRFTCGVCFVDFVQKCSLQRHLKKHQGLLENHQCPQCPRSFNRQDNLLRHLRAVHAPTPSSAPNDRIDMLAVNRVTTNSSPAPSTSSSPFHRANHPAASSSFTAVDRTGAAAAVCPHCRRAFSRRDALERHVRRSCPAMRGGSPPADSPYPSRSSGRSDVNKDPVAIPGDLAPDSSRFEEVESGFRGRLKTYRLREPASDDVTLPIFLTDVFDDLVTLMHCVLQYVTAIKVNLWVECQFMDVHGETCRRAFKTKNVVILRNDSLEDVCGEFFEKLITEKEACEMKGSGWAFVQVLDMEIRVNVYRPLKGSSYIALPPSIENKKAIINVLNDDQRCFMYAILTKYIDVTPEHRLRASDFTPALRARSNIDFSGLEFPVRLDKINEFEKRNGVSVNIYGLDLEKKKNNRTGQYQSHFVVYPLRIAKKELDDRHFDLLYLTDEERCHYAYISDFERLVHSQLTKHKQRIFVCKRCFAYFDNQPNKLSLTGKQRLQEHRKYCTEHAPLRTDIAEKEKIEFNHFERSQRSRFTIYADFESMLVPFDGERPLNPTPTVTPPAWDPVNSRPGLPHHRHHGDSPTSANVTTRSVHVPYAYAYHICDSHRNAEEGDVDDIDIETCETYSKLRLYSGDNVAQHFMSTLRKDISVIGRILFDQRQPGDPPRLTAAEEAEFQTATMCFICQKDFTPTDIKVRDHQHSPPYSYRGATHQLCNLRFKEQDSVNVYLHNMSNYDAHFIVRALNIDEGEVNVLANNEEKYISFTKRFEYPNAGRHHGFRVRFVDSYRFLAKSLATLTSLLPIDKMKVSQAHHTDPEKFQLLRRKGVFPYRHITALDVLQEDTLPPIDAFEENTSPEDYAHAQQVWEGFNCRTLEDYSKIYLTTDVLLLTDVFEGFRDMCLEYYKLDPAYYLTLPSYAWDVMLKMTGVTLDTLQDVDQYLFFEKGIRGGLTQCVTRHVEANNKYTRGDNIESDDDTFLMYYDANNLYGWAMSEPLPYGDFEWLSTSEIKELHKNLMDLPVDGEEGYVLEVDLEYPRDPALHDRHRDLPFCPEVVKAPADQLPYEECVLLNSGVGQSSKLMVTLMDKTEYVIHYRYLQQVLENGLRIRQIHRVLRFKQSPWLQPYVALNTRLRQLAKNKFEVELFKLMVNAVYGMSLQNVRKHKNIKICTSRTTYIKYVAKSSFSDRVWFDEDLALLNMAKVRVVLDKPVYVGMCVLDHSKWWMYGFHYRMVDRYGLDKISMAYIDTDGIVYRIRTGNAYRDMLQHKEEFDTSNYPLDHPCYDASNARVLGKFKDEAGGHVLTEFVGLMAKLYCISFLQIGSSSDNCGPPPIKRAKGVNRAVVQRDLTVDDYRRCLQDHVVKYTENERFMSRRHIIYTIVVRKRSLAPYDDKRYVCEDGVNTLPWGHYAITAAPRSPTDDEMPLLTPLQELVSLMSPEPGPSTAE